MITCWRLRGTNKVALLVKATAVEGDDLYVVSVLGGGLMTMTPRPKEVAERYCDAESVDKTCVWERHDFDTPEEFFQFVAEIKPPYDLPARCITKYGHREWRKGNLTAIRSYEWVDRVVIVDESQGRLVVDQKTFTEFVKEINEWEEVFTINEIYLY